MNIIDKILGRKKPPRASNFKSREHFWDASYDYYDNKSYEGELAGTSGLESRRKSEANKRIERLERRGFKESARGNACFKCEMATMMIYYKRNQAGEIIEGLLLCNNCGYTRPYHAWRPRGERIEYARKRGWLKDDMPHFPKGW